MNRGGGWADPAKCDSEEDDGDGKDGKGREADQGGVLYAMRQSRIMSKKGDQESPARREPTDDWGVGGLGQALQEASKAKRKEQEKKVKEAENEVRALTRLLESASAMAATHEKHERAAKAAVRSAENDVKEAKRAVERVERLGNEVRAQIETAEVQAATIRGELKEKMEDMKKRDLPQEVEMIVKEVGEYLDNPEGDVEADEFVSGVELSGEHTVSDLRAMQTVMKKKSQGSNRLAEGWNSRPRRVFQPTDEEKLRSVVREDLESVNGNMSVLEEMVTGEIGMAEMMKASNEKTAFEKEVYVVRGGAHPGFHQKMCLDEKAWKAEQERGAVIVTVTKSAEEAVRRVS